MPEGSTRSLPDDAGSSTRSGNVSRLRIAISMGDPNGIGPEVLLSCLADAELNNRVEMIPVGSSDVLRTYAAMLQKGGSEGSYPFDLSGVRIEPVEASASFHVVPGKADPLAGKLSMESVARAITLCHTGAADAMVTCPISKEVIARAGYDFPGHTEFIAERTGGGEVLMMMVSGALRVGLVTSHLPLSRVAEAITEKAVAKTLRLMTSALKKDFGIVRPRIAILGLNPHAGDGGVLGSEEMGIIIPAISSCGDIARWSGPLAADGFFGSGAWKNVDGVVAMYHDQGLAPFKALSFGKGVNVSAGLPIVRTSPDHGTGFDIAGVGKADSSSLKAAILLAADIAERRLASAHTLYHRDAE